MEYRRLGNSGLRVSAVGLGCNPFGNEVDPAGAERIVGRALDRGVTYFDSADSYFEGRSEEYLGRALAGRRDQVIVATKFGNPVTQGAGAGASRAHIVKACDDSLRRLRTDYIDVYQVHSPDRDTPLDETMRALDDLVRAGKVRYLGCSNFFEWEIVQSLWIADRHHLTPFVIAQDFHNLLYRDIEKRMEPLCVKFGLGMVAYFPLAGALLSGTYRRGVAPPPGSRGATRPTFKTWDSPRNWDVQEKLAAFAAERGWALPQMALAWLLSRPMTFTVIAGADTPEHIAANVTALDVKFSADDLAALDRITLVDEDRTTAPMLRRRF
ncbi:MAG TPA: aldo/keto reductase [Stellaceae bacterium]|nr:aldo/keto reductase [Stellaceae bacterium]